MAKKKEWREGEMLSTFQLQKITEEVTDVLAEWLTVETPDFSLGEQYIFDSTYKRGVRLITTWSEEDLKMKFISPVLELGGVMEGLNFTSFFDKKLTGNVQGYALSVKADFVVAKGVLDYMERPYFHFQEYKPEKNPTGDSMAQLLEAFLIAQNENNDESPLYGCEVNGSTWRFITMENKAYCVSKAYNSTAKEDLLKIIAILRKFRYILETRLLL
jgi:hypothetical protein